MLSDGTADAATCGPGYKGRAFSGTTTYVPQEGRFTNADGRDPGTAAAR